MQAGVALAERLRSRRQEMEDAICGRVYTIAGSQEAAVPAYAAELRTAVSVALDHGLEGLEAGGGPPPAVPVALIAQARLAARNDIGIDTVMRRYFAGHMLFSDFLVHEAGEAGLSSASMKQFLQAQGTLFDRLLVAIGEEFAREAQALRSSAGDRRLRLVRRQLAAEPVDADALGYDFGAVHLGLIATGPGADVVLRDLATALGHSPLLVRPDSHTAWAWLGGKCPLDTLEVKETTAALAKVQAAIAIGEPGDGLTGWRLTHRQAKAALPVAQGKDEPVVRYIDVAMLASAQSDDLLSRSLRQFYLNPLDRGRDGGKIARETLRAYLENGCNVSSAAAILRASRTTVGSRLRSIESSIGRPLPSCTAELRVALDLERLTAT